MQFNREFTFVTSGKIVNPMKLLIHFFNKLKHFILYHILSLNNYEQMV